jgi:hypothetical protein
MLASYHNSQPGDGLYGRELVSLVSDSFIKCWIRKKIQ